MRRFPIIALLLVLSLIVAACSSDDATPTKVPAAAAATATPTATEVPPDVPQHGGTLRIATQVDPREWNPIYSHFSGEGLAASLVYNTPFAQRTTAGTCDTQLETRALEGWRWIDDTHAEFTLREGMFFHDKPPVNGREMVADDMVYSLERMREWNNFQKPLFQPITGIEATGKYTVVISLSEPFGGLIEALIGGAGDQLFLMPREVVGDDRTLWVDPETQWIGTGPYMFTEWQPGVKWILDRNPNYYIPELPYFDRIEVIIVPDSNTLEAKLRAGEIDFSATTLSVALGAKLEAETDINVIRCPSSNEGFWNVIFMNNAGPPFDDVRVRQAASMAIDRQALKDLFMGGTGLDKGILAPGIEGYIPATELSDLSTEVLTYNPERAKELMAEAGYPDGFDTQINYTGTYPFPAVSFAEAEADMLTKVGIRTKVNLMERARWLQTVVQADYPIGEMGMSSGFLYGAETGMGLNQFYSEAGSSNRSIVKDPEYDALYLAYRRATDPTLRNELSRDMQVMAVEKAYRIFLFSTERILAAQPGLSNVLCCPAQTTSTGILFENAWWGDASKR
jgi:peptide/nickel transport system substrate-binding protein